MSNIKHQILVFNPETGSVLVKYYSETNLDGFIYNVDIPINNGEYISEEEFLELVNHLAPTSQLSRADQIKSATIPQYLKNFIATTTNELSE